MTEPAPPAILHLDTERGWRGGERQALWLARSLDPSRYRSLVAARPGEPLALHAIAAGLPLVPLAPVAELDPVAAWRLRRAIARDRVRIVHAHTAHAVALAALATRGTSARMVVTRRVDFRLRDNWGTRWKYRRAGALIAISRAVADALVASGIPRDRIEIIPSGIDLSRRIAPASRETLAAVGAMPGSPLVVQVAQLVPHKDPLTFVRAMAAARERVPDLHAVLVGDGPLTDAVRDAVAQCGLAGTVHVLGYRQDADALLAAADVVTLSSREEGLGTVLLDALALGKPVVATRAGGIPEIIEDGVSGHLVAPGDARSLGAMVAALLTDPARRAALAPAARRRAADFSITDTAARTAAVYDRLLRGDRPPF